jgi:hypothetical protein
MKRATILIGAVLALGMTAPAWAQGSLEHDDNGGGHPGQASDGYYGGYRPQSTVRPNPSAERNPTEQPRTTGRDSSFEGRNGSRSPNEQSSGTREDD